MADDLGSMVNEIVDETRRSMSGTIENLIRDAINHYEVERFFFNQFRDQTFSTSASQDYYTSADNSMIPRVLELDAVTLTISANDKPTLWKWSWQDMEDMNPGNSNGQPIAYSYWGQSIRFYPIPDGGYEVRLSGLMQDTSLSASTDSNGWTQRGKGKELIKQRAKSLLYSELLRDDLNATRAQAREREAFAKLKERTSRLLGTSEISPCL